MFCSNCGSKLTADIKFCSSCGCENPNFGMKSIVSTPKPEVVTTQQQINTIFNRDVLTNYLNNLQTLEFAKHKLTEEENILNYKISSLGHSRFVPSRSKLSDYGTHFGGLVAMVVIFVLGILINKGLNGNGLLSIFDDLLGPIVTFAQIAAVIIAIIIVCVMIRDYVRDGARYKRQTQEEADRLKTEKAQRERCVRALELVKRDLRSTTVLLDEAYSINIIPAKYRNIYAAYFLYEYISTSMVSLSEALYHCDLDEISQKLDEIIEQQKEIIMKLARSNALNERIINQNEQILKHAIATENNTALAAQYSQISAVNSKTVSQIQSYNFYKNGL